MLNSLIAASLALVPWPHEVEVRAGSIPQTSPVVVVADATIPAEGYVLDISPTGAVTIACSDAAGAFYARQTLGQLAVGTNDYACARVTDRPAYRWRGLLIDEGRHFFGKDVLKRTLDVMAQHKLNVLHWHLTEDQGWRLDVPGYPELVKYGAVRAASPRYGARLRQTAQGDCEMDLDGQPYGPYFYTASDVKEILAYAAERHIKVVPEIDLPGHVFSALAAYPAFACFPENLAKRTPRLVWGVEKDVLCVGNDKAIRFMEDILDFVCRLFPSDVIHLGGDECPQDRWKTCPKCQKRIRDEGLGGEKDLQPWITRHFVKFLAARGRRVLGWDECLLGTNVPQSVLGMTRWHERPGKGRAWQSPSDLAAKGHDVVMAPNVFTYLDYAQGLEDDPFQYIGGCVTLEKCHSLNPCAGVPADLRSRILGGQGSCRSEYTWNKFDLEWKTWPRACALAEVFWSGADKPSFDDFLGRMRVHRKRLIRQGVNCAPLD